MMIDTRNNMGYNSKKEHLFLCGARTVVTEISGDTDGQSMTVEKNEALAELGYRMSGTVYTCTDTAMGKRI